MSIVSSVFSLDYPNYRILEYFAKNGKSNRNQVGKYNSKYVKTYHNYKGNKHWKKYENKTGYQIIDGAHRLSLALFLKLDSVPVKIYNPLFFKIPDFTEYICKKEKEYNKNIEF